MKLSLFARYLILLIAGALSVLGIGSLTRLGTAPELASFYLFYTFAMLVGSVVLLFCYFQLPKRRKSVFWFTVTILALNVILTIFDQVGLIDILYMLLNLIALATLHLSRKDFLPE